MASGVPDDNPCNTVETEEETVALQKKRSRRVSFADREITSVYIFNRDEEYETSPDSDSRPIPEGENRVLDLFRELTDDGNPNGEDGEDVLDGRSSFLRPIQSPSPGGSSTLGSAASNDEENFFGPVSANFIRPGRLFDSAASDENHDVTMDSTAFSMHFRSLLRSDSGDLKTPTAEEKILPQVKTPSVPQNLMVLRSDSGDLKTPIVEEKILAQVKTPYVRENLMVLTREKHLMSRTPVPLNNANEGRDSEMSLVGENSDRYNYGALSPTLEALLADSGKDVPAVPTCDSIEPELWKAREVSTFPGSKGAYVEVKNYVDSKLENHDNRKISDDGVSVAPKESCEASGPSMITVFDGTDQHPLPLVNDDAAADASPDDQIHNLNQPKGDLLSEVLLTTDASMLTSDGCTPLNSRPGTHQFNLFNLFKDGIQTSAKEDLEYGSLKERDCHNEPSGSPTAGSISSLSNKRQQLLMNVINSPTHTKFATPSPRSVVSFSSKRDINPSGSVPLILSSKHKLKLSELSPCAPTVNARNQILKLMLSNSLTSKAPPLSSEMKKSMGALQSGCVDIRIMNLEKVLCDALTESNNLIENREAGHAQNGICNDQTIHAERMVASPSKVISSGENGITHFLTSNISVAMVPFALEPESPASKFGFDPSKSTGERIVSDKLTKNLDLELLSQDEHQRSPLQNLMQLDYDKPCLAEEIREDTNLQRMIVNECSPCKTPPREMWIQSPTVRKSNQSSEKKMQQNVSYRNNLQLFVARDSSSSDTQPIGDHNLASNVSHNMGHEEEILSSSCRKRTSHELYLGRADHLDEISRIQQSRRVLKVLENHSSFTLECSDGNGREKKQVQSDNARMNLTEVLNKLSADTDHMLPASVNNTNMTLIDLLGDALVHRQKVSATNEICSDIQLWTSDRSSDVKYKRVAEARSFLSKIMYEKVKLQLMCVKHKTLQKQVESLRAKVQLSLGLKSNCLSLRFLPGCEEAKVKQLPRVASTENEVATDKVTKMKSEIEDLEKKIKSLTSSFHFSLKLKGDPSFTGTIVLLNNQLKKRTCCRMMRNDIQLWEIEALLNRNGHQDVVLTYSGFICQRFTVNASMMSRIVVSNTLNDMNIMKNFPNMEAFSAFAFVFGSEFNEKFVGPGNLVHETQRISLLLSSLLDVVEEVRLARIEIRNLVQTRFHASSAGQLGLQLIFRDLLSCDKLMVNLDLTCLKCGVYPTDVQPSWLQHSTVGPVKSKLTDEIRAAVDDLGVGFWRIIRMCRCISQVIAIQARNSRISDYL